MAEFDQNIRSWVETNFEQGNREGKQHWAGFEESLLALVGIEKELLVFSDDDFMFKKAKNK